MRTSLDLPDPLFRTLKANAALQGTSLRDHVIALIERGMQQSAQPSVKREPRPVSALPTLGPEYALDIDPDILRRGKVNELLDEWELESHTNVLKHGSSTGEPQQP